MSEDTSVFKSKPIPKGKAKDDDRPDVIQTKYKRDIVAGQHSDAVPYQNEEGEYAVFKHRDTNGYYQYNAAFATDPAFTVEYMTKDEIIKRAVG